MMRQFSFFLLLLISFVSPSNLLAQNCIDAEQLIINAGERQDSLIRNQLELVLASCLETKDSLDASLGDLYHKLGVVYYMANLGDSTAIAYYTLAIKVREKHLGINHHETANSYYLRAATYNMLEKFEEAIADTEKAIEIITNYAPPNRDSLLGNYYLNIGTIYNQQGDYEQALLCLDKVLKFSELPPFDLNRIHDEKGKIYTKLSKYDLAIDNYQKALSYLEQLGKRKEATSYGKVLNGLGVAHRVLGKYEKGFTYLQKALNYFKIAKSIDSTEISDTYAELILLGTEQQQFSAIDEYFSNGMNIVKSYTNTYTGSTIAKLHYAKGNAEARQKNYTKAFPHFQKAIQAIVPKFNPAISENPILSKHLIGNDQKLFETLQYKAIAYHSKFIEQQDQKDLNVAFNTYVTLDTLITSMRQSFKAIESKYFLQKKIVPIYEKAIQTALELYRLSEDIFYQEAAYNFAAKNKAIILLEGLQDENAKFAGVPKELLERERQLKKQLYELKAQIAVSMPLSLDSLENDYFQFKRAYDQLITQFELKYPAYHELKYAENNSKSIHQIQENLEENQAVIEFFVGEDSLYSFVISKTSFQHYPSKIPAKFQETCYLFRGLTQGDSLMTKERYSEVADKLFQYLLAKPLNDLPKSISRLVIIPDNLLLQITFEALLYRPYLINKWNDQQIPYLLRKYAISYEYSNRLLFNETRKKQLEELIGANNDFLGFGLEYSKKDLNQINSSIIDSISSKRVSGYLKYSDDEVLEIKDAIGGQTFINEFATKQAFKANAPDATILHLAMHGVADEKSPLNSALIFAKSTDSSDYLLRASELYAMSLNIKMTVLSACQTGYGAIEKGEGMRSIARAFAYAGSQSLIASLWTIDDYSTKQILTVFYKNLKQGDSKDVALQKAKLKYLEKVGSNDALPYKWSQSILIGEVQTIFSPNKNTWWWGFLAVIIVFLFVKNGK